MPGCKPEATTLMYAWSGHDTRVAQNMRVSVHAHPLKAVEPELFAPEELLDTRPGLAQDAAHPESAPASSSSQGAHKWFANWFGSHQEGHSEDGNDSPLPQPPYVRSCLDSIFLGACGMLHLRFPGVLDGLTHPSPDMLCRGSMAWVLAWVLASSQFLCRMLSAMSLACMQTLRVPTSISEQEEVQVEVTRLLVECYFDIVRANLQVSTIAMPGCTELQRI
jgi:hypothetical protein